MWFHMARIVGEVRPRFVFVENSPMLTSRGLGTVLGDLAALGYDARWGVLGAADVGAPHQRDRIWIVAHTNSVSDGKQYDNASSRRNCNESLFEVAHANGMRELQPERGIGEQRGRAGDSSGEMADSMRDGLQRLGTDGNTARSSGLRSRARSDQKQYLLGDSVTWWTAEPDMGRVAHGLAARVDRLKAIGNGQVPAVAATAWRILTDENGTDGQ